MDKTNGAPASFGTGGSDAGQANPLERILSAIKGQSYPPVHLWNPDFCGDIDMRIARDGRWFYNGTPIGRVPLVKLFASVLRRDGDQYFLVTPVEKLGIRVDDAPFLAIAADQFHQDGEAVITFETNIGDRAVASSDNPIRVEIDPETLEPAPYIHIRAGLEALIARPVFYELVNKAEERLTEDGARELFVRSAGETFSLGTVPAEADESQ
ncbi:MAG: DUF1285 domain-containing protein [Pseudomonadota bacterium]